MSTQNLTGSNFEATVTQNPVVLVDFWASWCGPCRAFAPVFEKASEKYEEIVFGKVDTEAEQGLAAAAGITSIPTLMAFRDGILLYNQPGAMRAADLDSLIAAILEVDMDAVRAQVAEQKAPVAQ